MQFIDEATIHVKGGDGGAGIVHWRREKFIPQGGPDGGDGGNGGAVVLEASNNLNTLIDFTYQPHLKAGNGSEGGENLKTGAKGHNKIVKVPAGVQVFHEETLVADLSESGMRWVAARGGRGGKGNAHFKSAENQAPDFAQPGVAGEERTFRLVLKSIADIGLVGLPNAGKSTLVRTVSEAKPKVADYPFTTLRPELGVVILPDNKRFVIADIPGIIEHASSGKGLGIQFLKHIERTKCLLLVIDITQCPSYQNILAELANRDDHTATENEIASLSDEAQQQIALLQGELKSYSTTLEDKLSVIGFSKADMLLVPEVVALLGMEKAFLFSSQTRLDLDPLCYALWELAYGES